MLAGELISQNVPELIPGYDYRVRIKFKKYNEFSGGVLRVYMCLKDLKYDGVDRDCNKTSFDRVETSNGQNVINVLSFNLDNLPINSWIELSEAFHVDYNGYDWIAFELEGVPLCDKPYVILDDVELFDDACHRECARGFSNSIFFGAYPTIVDGGQPWSLQQFSGAVTYTMSVYGRWSAGGSTSWVLAYRNTVADQNGDLHIPCWRGDLQNGDPAPEGVYLIFVDAKSCCSNNISRRIFQVTKTCGIFGADCVADECPLNPAFGSSWYPKPCCLSDLLLTGQIVGMPQYYVNNSIVVEDATLGNQAQVILQAPNILIDGNTVNGTSIIPSGNGFFIASADDCSQQPEECGSGKVNLSDGTTLSNDEILLPASESDTVRTRRMANEDYSLSVFPIPAADNILISLAGKTLNRLEMYDLLGRPIRLSYSPLDSGSSFQADVSNIPSGNYVLRATDTEGRTHTRRVVVAR